MKKVLIVTALAGFIRSFLENDIKTLQAMGYEVHCAANENHPGAGDVKGYFEKNNVVFHSIGFSSRSPVSRESIRAYKQIRKIIKNNHYDMIHVHTPIAGGLVRIATRNERKKGCKIVYTTHGFFFHKSTGKKSWFVYYNVEKLLSRITDTMITINKEDFENAKTMRCERVKYINGVGVDTEKFQNTKINRKEYRASIGIKDDDIMVLSVGELSDRKNHQIIIKALEKINDSRYVYAICGNDMNKDGTSSKLKKLAKEKNVRLKLLGLRDDIPQLCKCADIGAFPSEREGLGLAGIELLAAGVPIVSSNVQGINDYMEDGKTGYTYHPFDDEGFAEGIRKLSDKTLRKTMTGQCVINAKKFDIKHSVSQMTAIYKEILGRKILHYSLGFPPYRSGGMTKFCIDLMQQQKSRGDTVGLIWPGELKLFGKRVNIKHRKNYDGIQSYEIINPLPISLNAGISDVDTFTKPSINPERFEEFLRECRPDIIHVHTLMGLHKELIQAARKQNIKIIFTAHDYFGICPKVTLFRNGQVCKSAPSCEDCAICNDKVLDMKKIFILQSPIYRILKNFYFIRGMRNRFKEQFLLEENPKSKSITGRENDYLKLRNYYIDILSYADKIHYNSTVTEQVYSHYVPAVRDKGVTISITHNNIQDNKKYKRFGEPVRITYLAPMTESKGFNMLIKTMDELWDEGEHWFKLNVYGNKIIERPYTRMNPRYNYSELKGIFDKTDLLVAPSLWYETFGYTVLEALSHGVPVIVTKHVGARDIVKNNVFGKIIDPNKEALKAAILSVRNLEVLQKYNENIVKEFDVDYINQSYQRMDTLYKQLIGDSYVE